MVLLEYFLEMIDFVIFNVMHYEAEILIQTVISYHCIGIYSQRSMPFPTSEEKN